MVLLSHRCHNLRTTIWKTLGIKMMLGNHQGMLVCWKAWTNMVGKTIYMHDCGKRGGQRDRQEDVQKEGIEGCEYESGQKGGHQCRQEYMQKEGRKDCGQRGGHHGRQEDEGDGGPEPEGEVEGEVEGEGEGEGEVEGQGEAEIESDGEPQDLDPLHGESEGERDRSSQEVEIGDQREESAERYSESDEKEGYGQRVVTSRRRDEVDSESERSGENHHVAIEDDEVNQARSPSTSTGGENDEDQLLHSAPEIRDVFGDSEDEEQAEYEVRNQIEDKNRSPMDEEENYETELRPEDIIPDEDARYDSEEEHIEAKTKEKPFGPPLELEIPLCPPPAESDKMNMIKVSNIMGIDPKPFDPHSYEEEEFYVTDESGSKKRIRLENNVVRWRKVKRPDGTASVSECVLHCYEVHALVLSIDLTNNERIIKLIKIESNARFVEWSDGSLQLLIGNEVLDISKQDAQQEQAHLFLRHGKGILQSQGRILTKMRFMPSSLASNSHRLLTALVDSRHKKVYKVKNCITDIDPEREKEQKEKAVNQSIKANEVLSRKKEKVSRKYTQPIRRERQLSPGFLEDALEEGPKDIPRKSAFPAAKSSRRPVDFSESEKEESEYETEGEEDEGSPPHRRDEDAEQDYAEEDEEHEQREEEETYESEEEAELLESLCSYLSRPLFGQKGTSTIDEQADLLSQVSLSLPKLVVVSRILSVTIAALPSVVIAALWSLESEIHISKVSEFDMEPKHKVRDSGGSFKRKDIESEEDSPPRKTTAHRRMKMVYESDEE
ncbi:hypothetical protein DH2020_043172 [Rehmannia glutinosa]|uniref:RNA polymerase-associated protein LEO1 n=1 Tax=Rehmannia glutinosa TaxID=99300 RepID=A0ABR0ULQ9_REHGL